MSSFLIICNFKILMVLVFISLCIVIIFIKCVIFLSNGFELIFTNILSVSFVGLVIYY